MKQILPKKTLGAATRLMAVWMVVSMFNVAPVASSAQTVDAFNPNGGPVMCIALQPDHKLLVGGWFKTVSGEVHRYIARLHADGTPDTSFRAAANDWVQILVIQENGQILVAGNFDVLNDKTRVNLGRLNPDGSLDHDFAPNPDGRVRSLVLQADGRIIIGGSFTSVAGQPKRFVARLNSEGSLDNSFNPQLEQPADSLVLQPDGKILVSTRTSLFRLNPDGTPDAGFTPIGFNTYPVLVLQPDGKILYGFDRYHPDGSLDSTFSVDVSGILQSIALQADGKILMAGNFRDAGTQTPLYGTNGFVIRVNPDGSRDSSFQVKTDEGLARSLLLPPDGKLVMGGDFAFVNGVRRYGMARVDNTEDASDSLQLLDSTLTWVRSGTSPEFWRVSVQSSTNGVDWHDLRWATRVPAGWQLAGVNLPPGGSIRARGFVNHQGSLWTGSAWFIERGLGTPFVSVQPISQTAVQGGTLELTVGAGGSGPLTYQWRFNGNEIQGATGARLTIQDLDWTRTGGYSVVMSGSQGSTTSSVAAVSIAESFRAPVGLRADGAIPTPGEGILVPGSFWIWQGDETYHLGRLHNDGNWDTSFEPRTNVPLPGILAVQTDGNYLVSEADAAANGEPLLKRLNRNGTEDMTFGPQIDGHVWGLTLQPDDKIIIWGQFTSVGGEECTNFARLNSDGTVDQAFRRGAAGTVSSVAVAAPDDLLVAGAFTALGGQPCTNLARLTKDGELDPSFGPVAPGTYSSLLPQGDGKILVSGRFTNVLGAITKLGRLNLNGTWDAGFSPPAVPFGFECLVLQANGKLLVASRDMRPMLRRLNPDGSFDPDFSYDVEAQSLALQRDGSIVGIETRGSVRKLENDEPATEHLSVDGTTIVWLRGGSSPELTWAEFETSTNGVDWTSVGTASRIPGGWQLTGLNLPDGVRIRARGQVSAASHSLLYAFSYPVETSLGAPLLFAQPSDQERPVGSRATFSVAAGGTLPIYYQWFFNSEPIPWETNALLSLPSLQSSDAGVYSLVASNLFGSVTSSVVRLTAINVPPFPVPELRDVILTNNTIRFSWDTLIGAQYQVQYTDDINLGTWTTVRNLGMLGPSVGVQGETITALGNYLNLTDGLRSPQRIFYRLVVLPRRND